MVPRWRSALPSVTAVAVAVTCLSFGAPAFAGDPSTSIKVNEVESQGLGDFIELANTSATPTDVGGLVLKDDDDAHALTIPAGTSIPAGGFLAVDTEGPGGFGLGASDAARVFLADGVTQVDAFSWSGHAATTYGRCPDGTGAFATTGAVTKGAANACPASPATKPWPGGASVTTVDEAGVLGGDVSGLEYEGSGSATPGVLWAVDNGDSRLLRLVWDGARWVRDTADGWSAGKSLRFPSGAGAPDAEGVAVTDAGGAGGVFVSSERDADDSRVSRPSILRYDASGAGATLTATHEWNLTPDLPSVNANAGLESVEWVPDSYLVGSGFVDQSTGRRYDPADYANHGNGLFFVGLEADGSVYAYALDQTSSTFTRVATFASGFPTFGALHFDGATNQLWVVCDNNCSGRSRLFAVDTQPGATSGHFVAVADYARPAGMANLNNEGFAIGPASECVGGSRPVLWADDGNTDGHALRAGTIPCLGLTGKSRFQEPLEIRTDKKAFLRVKYLCKKGDHLWVSAKQTAGGEEDPVLEAEGASRLAATWWQSHANPFVCDGTLQYMKFRVDRTGPGSKGTLRAGRAWFQFCLTRANGDIAVYREAWVDVVDLRP